MTMLLHVHIGCRRLLSRLKQTAWARYFSDSKLKVAVKVISSGGFGTSKSIMVDVSSTEQRRMKRLKNGSFYTEVVGKSYMFNCGEGSKRFFTMNKFKKNSVEDIFITATNWGNLGGLKGLFTEQAKFEDSLETFHKGLKLHGPELMLDRFYVGQDAVYSVVNATTDMFHEDEYVQIKYIPFFPELSDEDLKHYPAQLAEQTKNWKIEGVQSSLERKLSSIVYILKVLEEEESSLPTIMILECPDKRYIKSLLASEDLQKHQREHGAYIFHLSPISVMEDPSYKTFIGRFHESNEHLHVDETQGQPSLDHLRHLQKFLHQLDNKVFPLFPSCADLKVKHENPKLVLRKKSDTRKVLSIKSGRCLLFQDQSMKLISTLREPQLSSNRKIQNLMKKDTSYFQSVKDFVQKQNRNKVRYPEILFLGTAATISTMFRNVTGIYLQTDPDTAILLDCGEGTYTQMCLFYGSKTNEMLRKIKCIFISHLHADHIVGLASILAQRSLAFKEIGVSVEPVDIVGEDDLAALRLTIAYFVPNILEETELHVSRKFRSDRYSSEILQKLKLEKLRTVKALHNFGRAHSVSFKHEDGWHLVFSGDTMFNEDLVKLGKSCDILIHEATYPSNATDWARKTDHSTVTDALKASTEMHAKKTILTHFNPMALVHERELVLSRTDVTIAMDHMKVQLDDLDFTPLYNPFLLELSKYIAKQRY